MVIIGEPKLLRCFVGDTKEELLSIVEAFAQFKVFKGHTSRDGP